MFLTAALLGVPFSTLVVSVLVICILIGVGRAYNSEIQVVRHWSQLIDGLSHSSRDFYATLTQELLQRDMPDVVFSEVTINEGAPLVSAERLYLRVKRNSERIEICAAPFGRGFFFSSWLVVPPSALRLAPIIGPIIGLFCRPTYYRLDTAGMFHAAVHQAMLDVIDGVTSAKGVRALTEGERKPVMRGFVGRTAG